MKTTNQPNISVWGIRGWDTKNNSYKILAYATETKAQAYAKCIELHPTLDVESVYKVADY